MPSTQQNKQRLDPEKVDTVVIHTTDSYYGDVATVNQWHRDKGWAEIGYHYLILNCFPTRHYFELRRPVVQNDGKLCRGRLESFRGAHVKGHNWHSFGVAMVGQKGQFTSKQIETAVKICKDLKERYPNLTRIMGHFEFDDNKTCPDIDMDLFRNMVERR